MVIEDVRREGRLRFDKASGSEFDIWHVTDKEESQIWKG
jgi:hypothetical protein